MIASIVGNYLMEIGLIDKDQFRELLKEHRRVRVKLGLIAVSEGLMTQEEADRVNRLQAIMDMRFGDIAVEERYLTEDQVESLLEKQGNPYLAFAQALENQQIIKMEQLEKISVGFQYANNYTDSDMEAFKSGDMDHILRLYLPEGSERYELLASIAIRTLMRLVDQDVWVKKSCLVSGWETEKGAFQRVYGEDGYACGLVCKGDGLAPVACAYGQEHFMVVDDDALDAIGELINCINGLIIAGIGDRAERLELYPPMLFSELARVRGKELLVITLGLLGQEVDLIITLNNTIVIA